MKDSGAARARCMRVSWVLARCARWILASPQPTKMSKFSWPRERNDSYSWSSFIRLSHQHSNTNIWILNVGFSNSRSSVSLSSSAKREWDPTGNNSENQVHRPKCKSNWVGFEQLCNLLPPWPRGNCFCSCTTFHICKVGRIFVYILLVHLLIEN